MKSTPAPVFVRDWRPLEPGARCLRPSFPIAADLEAAAREHVADPDDPGQVRRKPCHHAECKHHGRCGVPIIALPAREWCDPFKLTRRASAEMMLERGEVDWNDSMVNRDAMAKSAANEPDPDDIARDEMRAGA